MSVFIIPRLHPYISILGEYSFFKKNRAKTNSLPRNVLAESDRLDLLRLLRMRQKHHKKLLPIIAIV